MRSEWVAGSAERAGPGAETAEAPRGVRLRRPVGQRVIDRGQVAACPGAPVVGRRAGSTRQGHVRYRTGSPTDGGSILVPSGVAFSGSACALAFSAGGRRRADARGWSG